MVTSGVFSSGTSVTTAGTSGVGTSGISVGIWGGRLYAITVPRPPPLPLCLFPLCLYRVGIWSGVHHRCPGCGYGDPGYRARCCLLTAMRFAIAARVWLATSQSLLTCLVSPPHKVHGPTVLVRVVLPPMCSRCIPVLISVQKMNIVSRRTAIKSRTVTEAHRSKYYRRTLSGW
jgi:hypothetical protein